MPFARPRTTFKMRRGASAGNDAAGADAAETAQADLLEKG